MTGLTDVEELAARCLDVLRSDGATLVTAESLTAGLIAATVAAVPGASDVLRGGLVAYATDVKTAVLGVDPELVDRYGVVSAECAEAMAVRAREMLSATWALSATGVAGPTRQEDKPPGTGFVGVAGPRFTAVQPLSGGDGGRRAVRHGAVWAALALLQRSMGGPPG